LLEVKGGRTLLFGKKRIDKKMVRNSFKKGSPSDSCLGKETGEKGLARWTSPRGRGKSGYRGGRGFEPKSWAEESKGKGI